MREDEFSNKINLNVNENPLQLPGRHERLRIAKVGGDDGVDRRMIFTGEELEKLLEVCRASMTGRVILHQVGIQCDLYREERTGHRYEIWKLTAGKVVSEENPWINEKGQMQMKVTT